jgi:hypothetical protein
VEDLHREHQYASAKGLEPESPRHADPSTPKSPHVQRARQQRLDEGRSADSAQDLAANEDDCAEGTNCADDEHAEGDGGVEEAAGDPVDEAKKIELPVEKIGEKMSAHLKKMKTQTMREIPKAKEV